MEKSGQNPFPAGLCEWSYSSGCCSLLQAPAEPKGRTPSWTRAYFSHHGAIRSLAPERTGRRVSAQSLGPAAAGR